MVITGGTGKGQERTVDSYSNNQLTVESTWDVNPDSTSTFAIRETLTTPIPSRTDQYTVVLTGAPTNNVTIDLVSEEIKTYNDKLKFDDSQNKGQRTAQQIEADELSLIFTTADWFTPQPVVLSGITDDHVDGDAAISFPDARSQVTDIRLSLIHI